MNTKEVDKSIAKSDKYKDFQDSQLEEIYKDIKKTKTLDGIQESLIIAIEAIKRIYNYKTTEADIEKLNLFLNNVSINISNGDTFYAFLLFSTIMDLQNQQLHALFVDDFLVKRMLYSVFYRNHDGLVVGSAHHDALADFAGVTNLAHVYLNQPFRYP